MAVIVGDSACALDPKSVICEAISFRSGSTPQVLIEAAVKILRALVECWEMRRTSQTLLSGRCARFQIANDGSIALCAAFLIQGNGLRVGNLTFQRPDDAEIALGSVPFVHSARLCIGQRRFAARESS